MGGGVAAAAATRFGLSGVFPSLFLLQFQSRPMQRRGGGDVAASQGNDDTSVHTTVLMAALSIGWLSVLALLILT